MAYPAVHVHFLRHPQYYFPDGNVVLVAGNIAFRVHGSVLSLHSNVFRDMLGIPRPADDNYLYDECPIMPLLDTVEEVRAMLSALYDSISQEDVLYHSRMLQPLRLEIKYEFDKLRDESVHRFEECFPKSLSSFEKLALESSLPGLSSEEDEDTEAGGNIPIQFSDVEEIISIIPLARNCNLPSILPQVFYICAQYPFDTPQKSHSVQALLCRPRHDRLNGSSTTRE
ncbi:hypothetical protein C8Q75DRAFT_788502 [Abortiporus biennis]|nr:hypothetical protein C8Q75DRAFT_788502 [Abortiporus biennis]